MPDREGAPERVDFFVSYTSADRPWAEWIARVLEDSGHRVLIQAWDFNPGANWVLEMDRAATISDRTVAVLSPAFLESRYTAPEWAAAFREDPTGSGRKLVPVRVRECHPHGLLASLVYVDLVGLDDERARERLLDAVAGGRTKPSAGPDFPGGHEVAHPPAGAAIWNVPPVSGRFVGRERLVSEVAERLAGGEAAALTQVEALHGLGGVGKTRVAVEYAHRRRERYDVVWWVRAENPLTLLGDYAALADALALPEREEREQNTRAAAVTTWLERHPRWLLVFDNAPSPDAVRELIPRTPSGHVLITSRQQGGWRGIADPVAIDVWSREESLNFLSQRTGDKDAAAATAIAEALADLPLALEQAAAYVDSNGISLAGYQHRLESQAPALFQRGRPADYEHTIATTWELAFAELEQDPGCAALLFCCAFFAPERIPRELFLSETIANGVFAAGGGELALDDAIGRILSFSLVTADDTTLSMHRLVQHVIRDRLGERRDHWLTRAQELLIAGFPVNSEDPGTWATCDRLLPHALASCGHATEDAGAQTAILLGRVGDYLVERGEYRAAISTLDRALQLTQAVLGPEHPHTLTSANNLGSAYRVMGRFGDAILLYESTLKARERIVGPEHAHTLISRNNLASAYQAAGRPADAIPLYEQTLAALERILGPEHPRTLACRNNLGYAYQETGRLDDAILVQEETLSARERLLGAEHRDTLISRNNLAHAYHAAGRFGEALPLFEETLSAHERVLGPEHPATLTSRNNLAGAYQAAGRLDEAVPLYEETLGVRERTLGREHPDTLLSRNNVAHAYNAMGRVDQAVSLYKQTLTDAEQHLGVDHPITKTVRANLEQARGTTEPR